VTVPEIQEVVRDAIRSKGTVTARGFGTYARKEPPGARIVDMCGMDRIVDYDPADLTATVEAGCRFDALDAALAEHGQWLPVDVSWPEGTTVGGMLAVGLVGPLGARFGTLRDQLIGVEWVGGEGQVLRSGGRVVKNVAGYDLMKLHVGARGQFGILTRATFKVRPRRDRVSLGVSGGASGGPAAASHSDRTSMLAEALRRSLDPSGVFRA